MSKETTIWIVIAVYVLFMLAVGILNSKNSKGMAAFTVGGRNAGAWISALSYGCLLYTSVFGMGDIYPNCGKKLHFCTAKGLKRNQKFWRC